MVLEILLAKIFTFFHMEGTLRLFEVAKKLENLENFS